MKAKFVRSYRSKKGNMVFVYALLALSVAQLEQVKAAQGDNFRTAAAGNTDKLPEGTVLFFSPRYFGNTGTVLITGKGALSPDMSEFEKMASLSAQFGGNLGQALARQAASQLLGGNSVAAEAPVQTPTPEAAADSGIGEG